MKRKRYNHDNDLLFMPNGPTTKPNRTELDLGWWVRTVSKFTPFVVIGLVSVALMIPNTRPLGCISRMDGWWAGGHRGLHRRARIDFLGMGTKCPYVLRMHTQKHSHTFTLADGGNRKFIPNHNNFSIMNHKPNIWLHLERCRVFTPQPRASLSLRFRRISWNESPCCFLPGDASL